MNKETRAFIDEICDQPPVEPNEESRTAGLVQMIVNDEVDPALEILQHHQEMLQGIIRILQAYESRFEDIKGHLKNHDLKFAARPAGKIKYT